MRADTLHRRCHGLARGWLHCLHGYRRDDGGFPRLGWWAVTTAGASVYLGPTPDDVLRRYGAYPLPPPSPEPQPPGTPGLGASGGAPPSTLEPK